MYLSENIFTKLKDKLKTGIQKISRFKLKQGQFLLMEYKAKGYEEKTLPFYDKTPLILVLSKSNRHGNYMGLNFNYLPPVARKRVTKQLKRLYKKQWGDNKTLPNVTYKTINKQLLEYDLSFIIKEYIPSRMSKTVIVTPEQFEKTLDVDLGTFIGINITELWREYRKGIPINTILMNMKKKKLT
jgi:hypothetical protein